MANPKHLGKILRGVDIWNEWRERNTIPKPNLNAADLRGMRLSTANLEGTDLGSAYLMDTDLGSANLMQANLQGANLERANLIMANLHGANLERAKLGKANLNGAKLPDAIVRRADLGRARLRGAKLERSDLADAYLCEADLNGADLSGADLRRTDLRSAKLQSAKLDGAIATGIRLWEIQHAGWSIRGLVCENAYWDKGAREPTNYAPGEFEKLYSDQTCIELFYKGGVSTFELNTLPALLHHLVSLNPDTNIRLRSIEESGGGARISISVGDASTETADKIKADAMQVYQAQLALRERETDRLLIEKNYLEKLMFGKLIPAMLTAGTPHNVFNAPVTGVVISSGESKVDFHQTVNDNTAILALLERIMSRRQDLGLSAADARKLEAKLQSATTELQKPNPDKSVLSKSLSFIQSMAAEGLKGAAGKIGESAVTDWQSWLHQLAQTFPHWK
jgi:uncharacterized protein YjbI with pentapeptide repeats